MAMAATFAQAEIPTRVIARTSWQMPGEIAGHTFTFFGAPSIGNGGDVAFRSQSYGFGIFTSTSAGVLSRVALVNQAPDLPAGTNFSIVADNPTVSAGGAVGFSSSYSGVVSGTGGFSNATGSLASVVLPGDPLVGHPLAGTFDSFGTNGNPVLIGDNGITAYNSWTSTFPGQGSFGIWAGVGKAGMAKVALTGDPAPGLAPNTLLYDLGYPVMNAGGTLAFQARLSGSGTTFYNTYTIWSGKAGNIAPVARSDSAAPGTAGKFYWLYDPDISSTGKVAFRAALDSSVPFAEQYGIWSGTAGALNLVAQSGKPAAGVPGATYYNFNDPLINAAGIASFTGTVNNLNGDAGLWTGSDSNHLNLVAKVGDHAPGTGNGVTFVWPSNFDHVLNNLGQIAFIARLTGTDVTSANDYGLWVYDPLHGTQLIAREGQSIQVAPGVIKTISSLDLRVDASSGDGRATSLNDKGQLAFTVGLSGGIDYAILVANMGGTLPGDANQNGIVDAADFAQMMAHMNSAGAFAEGDFNLDGFVTAADLALYQMYEGQTSQPFSPTIGATLLLDTAPEPASVGFVAVVTGVSLMRRKRRG